MSIREVYLRTGSMRATARELGCSWGTVKKALANYKIREIEGTAHTYKELLEQHGINLEEWEVVKLTVGGSDVTLKIDNQPVTKQNKNFKVSVVPKPAIIRYEKLISKIKPKKVPQYEYWPIENPHDAVLSIHDAHLGKLAWALETKEDYDLAIAERIILEAIKGLANKVQDFPIRQWYIPIGSDFFNVDNLENTTTKGTPQDQDGRVFKVFETGQRIMEQIIETLVQVAPVKLFYLPGNHDYLTSWFLANTLKALYRDHPDIEIDTTATSRQFELLGSTLVVFDHGDKIKKNEWPRIILDECPKAWLSKIKRKEVQLGHEHQENLNSYGETIVRTNAALSGIDSWHYRKGYIGGARQALAHLYDENGYSIMAVHNVHASEFKQCGKL